MDDRFVFMAVDSALASEKASFVSYRMRLEPLIKEEERGGNMLVNKGLDFSFSFSKIFLPLYRRANPQSIQCIQCM